MSIDATMSDPVQPDRLRNRIRQQRRALSPQQQQCNANALAKRLHRQCSVLNAGRIACYLPNDGEIGTRALIACAWSRHQQVLLPVLSPLKNSLYFAPYTSHSELTVNRYGIAEPACHPTHWLKAQQLDVILLPLVAFDNAGNRLGMGGGYYDRTLAFLQLRQHRRKPTLIGLAHELQCVDTLQTNYWDIPLDALATEDRFIQF